MAKPDITHLLRAKLRETLLDAGAPADDVDAAVDELMELAEIYARRFRDS